MMPYDNFYLISLPRMSRLKFFLSSPAVLDTIQVYLPASSTAVCIRRRLRPPGDYMGKLSALICCHDGMFLKVNPHPHLRRKTFQGCVNYYSSPSIWKMNSINSKNSDFEAHSCLNIYKPLSRSLRLIGSAFKNRVGEQFPWQRVTNINTAQHPAVQCGNHKGAASYIYCN